MSGSASLVRRHVLAEARDVLGRLLLVRHEWQLIGGRQEVEDAVGFAFVDALPARAALLDVHGLAWLWHVQLRVRSALLTPAQVIHVCGLCLAWRGCVRLGAAQHPPLPRC
jgi:hypothetical protein